MGKSRGGKSFMLAKLERAAMRSYINKVISSLQIVEIILYIYKMEWAAIEYANGRLVLILNWLKSNIL